MTDALELPLVFAPPFQWKIMKWITHHEVFVLKGIQVWLILIIMLLAWWILMRENVK